MKYRKKPVSKLTEEQERQLIDDFKNGATIYELLPRYGINTRAIEEIIRKEILRIEKEDGV